MVADGDTPSTDMPTETTNASDNDPDADPLEGAGGLVEVKKMETSQTALFPPGPWWR